MLLKKIWVLVLRFIYLVLVDVMDKSIVYLLFPLQLQSTAALSAKTFLLKKFLKLFASIAAISSRFYCHLLQFNSSIGLISPFMKMELDTGSEEKKYKTLEELEADEKAENDRKEEMEDISGPVQLTAEEEAMMEEMKASAEAAFNR